jgi:hypothetical protein
VTWSTTRRGLLKRGLLGALLLAAGGSTWLALRPSALLPLPEAPLRLFTPAQYSILMAVIGRCVPDPVSTHQQRQETALRIDTTLAGADHRTRSDFTQLLGLLDNALAGLLLDANPTPFTHLAATDQEAVLEDWRTSRIGLRRAGYQALRRIVVTHYYADPANQIAIGYPGPPKGVL